MIVQTKTLRLKSNSGDEVVYFCPECITVKGTPDKKGKLYFNTVKGVGICFRCNTKFSEEGANLSNTKSLASKQIKKQAIEKPKTISFDFPALDKECLSYLSNRHIYLPELAGTKQLNLKRVRGNRKGIVFPFYYEGKIAKCQIRYLDSKDKQSKYWTQQGSKLPYSPYHVFKNFKLKGSGHAITICEGVFDSIALAILGFPNPVAVLGKTVTKFQVEILRRLVPSKIILALDELELSQSLKKEIKYTFPCVEKIDCKNFIVNKEEVDPEEYLVHHLSRKSKQYDERVNDWIAGKII